MGCCGSKTPAPRMYGGSKSRTDIQQPRHESNVNSLLHSVTNKDDFEYQLQEAGSRLIIADFYATWCGPCKMVAPKLEEMASQMKDVLFIKVDMDENEEIAAQYAISCMPTFMFFKKGIKVTEFSGPNIEKLKELIILHK